MLRAEGLNGPTWVLRTKDSSPVFNYSLRTTAVTPCDETQNIYKSTESAHHISFTFNRGFLIWEILIYYTLFLLLHMALFLVALAMGFRASQLAALMRHHGLTVFAMRFSHVSMASVPTHIAKHESCTGFSRWWYRHGLRLVIPNCFVQYGLNMLNDCHSDCLT